MGSGCGSVGRAVASNSRGPRFKSSHQQKNILNIYRQLYWKDENKEKEAGSGPLKKKRSIFDISFLSVSVISKVASPHRSWPTVMLWHGQKEEVGTISQGLLLAFFLQIILAVRKQKKCPRQRRTFSPFHSGNNVQFH